MKVRLAELSKAFYIYQVPEELIQLVLHPINDFISLPDEHNSYSKIHFLNAWLDRLQSPTVMNSGLTRRPEFLYKQVIAFNLNSEKCINHLSQYTQLQCSARESKADQLRLLHYYHKFVKQTTPINGWSYQPDQPALQQTLSNWLIQEINYMTNTCHINDKFSQHETPPTNDHKLNTGLSVSQLACYLRLCVESDIFSKAEIRKLIKHFSQHCATKQTDNISFESLYNKFYSPERGAVDAVKTKILEQLKLIQSNKI
ncbi:MULTISPECIES: hypothetical protein [unclassified Carboxylicivirga]|uniref:hypothetical protein n=1 Tax=Carboxylicivirga TaxID=1628153 RepID=UPI003D3529FB